LSHAPNAWGAPSAQELFEAALAKEQQSDTAGARALYEQVLGSEPEHGRSLINLGLLEIRERKIASGLKRCQKASDLDPNAAKAHYCLGLGWVKSGKDAEGAAAFERSIALLKDEPSPKIELGHIRRKAKQWDAAIQLYREAVRLKADEADLHVNLGYCYKEKGELPAAEVEYRKAVQKDPASYFGNLNLGWVLVKTKRDAEAEPFYLKATELDPKQADPNFNLGNLYRRKGELEKARDRYARAVELAPDRAEHHLELARTLWSLGDAAKARVHLDRAAELKPDAALAKAIERTRSLLGTTPPKRVVSDPSPNSAQRPAEDVKPGPKTQTR
jgi:tetratricopeptide (TPR) repeat protein